MEQRRMQLNVDDRGIAWITLAASPLNLFSVQLTRDLDAILDHIETRNDIRVVVFEKAEEARAFSAGSDIREFSEFIRRQNVIEAKLAPENRVFTRVEQLSHPTLASLQGWVLGSGLELAIACDFRIAGHDSRLGFPEITLGAFPGSGGLFRLPELVGLPKALELILFGEHITAQEALRIGLVHRVLPPQDLNAAVVQWAGTLAQRPPRAMALAKQVMRATANRHRADITEDALRASQMAFAGTELPHGISAFLQKQRASFGRSS